MKHTIRINENQLKQIVTESVKRVLKERYGVDDDSLEATRIGNHKKRRGVKTKGSTETRDFLRQQTEKGNPIIKYKRNPKEWLDNLMSQSDGKITLSEAKLNKIIKESVKRVLNEQSDYDEDEFNDFVSSFDNNNPQLFNIEQYHYINREPELIFKETGLSKERALEIFKKATKEAYEYNYNHLNVYNFDDYIGWPIVSTTIETIYGKKIVKDPPYYQTDRDICDAFISNKWYKKEDVEKWCTNAINHTINTFFSGKYEYSSY